MLSFQISLLGACNVTRNLFDWSEEKKQGLTELIKQIFNSHVKTVWKSKANLVSFMQKENMRSLLNSVIRVFVLSEDKEISLDLLAMIVDVEICMEVAGGPIVTGARETCFQVIVKTQDELKKASFPSIRTLVPKYTDE